MDSPLRAEQNNVQSPVITDHKFDDRLKRLAPVALRMFLAGVFLWFGITQLLNSQGWVSYLPEFLQHTPIDPTVFIFLNASMEVVLGVFLILGAFVRLSGLVLGLHLLGIASTLGINAIGVRDIGLGLACVVIAFNGADFFSLDSLISKNRLEEKGHLHNQIIRLLLAVIALGLLGVSFYIYITNTSFGSGFLRGDSAAGGKSTLQARGPNEVLSVETVAKHNSASDCWLIIEGKVYNVTPYIEFHPGGKDRIIQNCGTDATTAFNTKGGTGGSHSVSAHNILAGYYLGSVGEGVAVPLATAAGSGQNQPAAAFGQTPPSASSAGGASAGKTTVSLLSASQVASHKTAQDCWLIIAGKVYNVTQYIPFHPGGQDRIIQNCGKDATTAFNTKGGTGGTHSANAHNILAGYYLGDIGKAAGQGSASAEQPAQTSIPASAPPPTVSIISPASGAAVSGVVAMQASAQSQAGILNLQFVVDSQFLGTANTAPYSMSLSTANFSNGQHTLKVTATDLLSQSASATVNFTVNNPVVPTPAPTPSNTNTTLTAAQVATHNSSSDCWLIISGNVYNVTQYIPFHPGGQDRIIQNCGTDATTAFNTKGGTGSTHSTNAHNILAGYLIGTLGTSPAPTPAPGSTPTPTPAPSGSAVTYTVTINSSGIISPASLTINAGDTVKFVYTNPGDEKILVFSPTPPSSIKLDHDTTSKSYTFNTPGTYSYHPQDGGGTNATITVQ